MVKNVLTLSEKARLEYCCTVVRIEEIKPIEGSDFLGSTLVNGNPIVVRKDQIKEGDIMIYAPIETVLNKEFLSVNNLFEIGERDRNSNFKEVAKLIEEGKKDEAKKLVGFFNKHGRVKLIRLRGCPSMGFLMEIESLVKWMPKLKDVDWESLIGTDFDTINDKLFVKVYVPFVPEQRVKNKHNKRDKKLKGFKRLVDGQFTFHYDTSQLQRNIQRISPDDIVTISNKLHGSSAIFANILTRKPLQLSFMAFFFNKMINKKINHLSKNKKVNMNASKEISFLKKKIKPTFKLEYGNVYSSRTVIKNQYINQGVSDGYYGTDIWCIYNEIIKPFIPKGYTIYGEICGYIDGSQKMIQKQYDYGMSEGESFLMIYRMTSTREDGTKKEWEVMDVKKWTEKLIKENPQLQGKIVPIPVLYHGTLKDLYPNIDVNQHWHENVLEALRTDKEHFGMEELEPQCKHSVPREGIVLRISGDTVSEAFKLKTIRFLQKEGEAISNGEVDSEMVESYSE